MKKYIKADGIKTDIFKKATQQAAINQIYLDLNSIEESIKQLDDENFAKLELSQLYQDVRISLRKIRPYYRG